MDVGIDVRRLLKEGDLASALERAKEAVRADPASAAPRILLFQLFAVLGEWERASGQLAVVAGLAPDAKTMVLACRALLASETARAGIFAGQGDPVVIGHPPPWVALLLEALRLDGRGDAGMAARHRAAALEAAPAIAGTIDGTPFSWLADGDQRLGPVLEAVVNGRLGWIPLPNVRSLVLEPPRDLRDLVWMPATITLVNGGELAGFVPTRYPGTTEGGDAALMLSRRTDWAEGPDGELTGLGQRMYVTDVGEYALMDVRRIEFESGAANGDG